MEGTPSYTGGVLPYDLFLHIWGWIGPEQALQYIRTVPMTADQIAGLMRLPWIAGWVSAARWDVELTPHYRGDTWGYETESLNVLCANSAVDRRDHAAVKRVLQDYTGAKGPLVNTRVLRAAILYGVEFNWGVSAGYLHLFDLLIHQHDTKIIPAYFVGSAVEVLLRERWDDIEIMWRDMSEVESPTAAHLLNVYGDVTIFRKTWQRGFKGCSSNNKVFDSVLVAKRIHRYYGREVLRAGLRPEHLVQELDNCLKAEVPITYDDIRALTDCEGDFFSTGLLHDYLLEHVADLRPYERYICTFLGEGDRAFAHFISDGCIDRLLALPTQHNRVLNRVYFALQVRENKSYVDLVDAFVKCSHWQCLNTNVKTVIQTKYVAIKSFYAQSNYVDTLRAVSAAIGNALELCADARRILNARPAALDRHLILVERSKKLTQLISAELDKMATLRDAVRSVGFDYKLFR